MEHSPPQDSITIPLSKTKIFLLFLGALAFVIIGCLLIFMPEEMTSAKYRNPQVLRIIGIASVLFFGLALLFSGRKLFDQQIGLTIDDRGITDNTNATSIGLIEWEDITGIRSLQISTSKILMIDTDQPQKYIAKARNGIAKKAMQANARLYGSPLSIIASSLKIKFSQLEETVYAEFEKRTNDQNRKF